MRIFDESNASRRIVVYDDFDLELLDRHQQWCLTKTSTEKDIYMVFILQNPEQIKLYRSNRIENKFSVVYCLDRQRSKEWMINFCKICYSEDAEVEVRANYKMRW